MASSDSESREFIDYFHEVNDIEQGQDAVEQPEEELSKTPDEGEQEVAWLKDAGYGHLVSKISVGQIVDNELLEIETDGLTEAQAAVVKKRINTLKSTFGKRSKTQKTDVREIFGSQQQQPGCNGSSSSTASSMQDLSATHPDHHAGVHKPAYRTSLLRHRGGYNLAGNASSVVDGIVTAGICTLYVHATEAEPSFDTAAGEMKSDTVDGAISSDGHVTLKNYTRRGSRLDGPLPDLTSSEDSGPGITLIDGLGKKDLDRVRSLALIELTALYDNQGISYVRRKAKGHGRETGLFGVPLHVLLEHDQKRNRHLRVPLILQELVKYLEATSLHEEGILRVPGAVARVKALRQELEARYKHRSRLTLSDIHPHDAAALLKQFLRELPIPLLTFEYLEAFTQLDKISDLRLQVQALNFLVLLLPDVHRNCLQLLLEFLKKIVDVEQNKMTIGNVAMIIAPNLFLVGSTRPAATGARRTPKNIKDHMEVSMAAGNSNIVQLLIHYQTLLWQVPASIMSQVRRQYQAELKRSRENRPFRRLLGRKEKSAANKKLLPFSASETQLMQSSNVIRVNAPQLSKFNTTIQLDQLLTAGDVIAKFSSTTEVGTPPDGIGANGNGDALEGQSPDLSPDATVPPAIHLYEVGGNIGERRLDLGTNIMSLYQVNPNAELVIKKQPLY